MSQPASRMTREITPDCARRRVQPSVERQRDAAACRDSDATSGVLATSKARRLRREDGHG